MYKKQGSPQNHEINSMLEGLMSTFKRRSSRNYLPDSAVKSLQVAPKLSTRGLMKLNMDIRPLHAAKLSVSSNVLGEQAAQQIISPNMNHPNGFFKNRHKSVSMV
jgi:hypothetical protein